ncbi:MAG: DUF4190 domain-containing protein [Planctomycetes bacterium]|nr:DUF4190 domain-containing protein [Planctomycetota bacterium]
MPDIQEEHSKDSDDPAQAGLVPCRYCGEMIKAIARKCRHCREYLDEELRAENRAGSVASTTDRLLMPVDRPLSAIAAGYLGLLSLLPLFGILAIAFGFYALSVLKKNPTLIGRGRAIFGIVMGILFTLLYGAGIVSIAMGY